MHPYLIASKFDQRSILVTVKKSKNGFLKHALPVCALLTLALSLASAQTAATVDPKTIPVIDGGIGPCTADFTVTDPAGKPVYDAKIRVHIAYRFAGAHKLDLEVGTNTDGKARFEGLPTKSKRGLSFQASHEDFEGTAFVDTATTCKSQLTITLQKKQ